MQQTVTLAKVQEAMKQLRDTGERVSRRNVWALTGGGMSTVHRLMSEIQEAEILQAKLLGSNVSPSLHQALAVEIQGQIQKATTALQDQIAQLKEREGEALSALAQAEATITSLETALESSKDQVQQEQEGLLRAEGSFLTRQLVLDQTLQERQAEIESLRNDLLGERLKKERIVFQAEQLEKALAESECRKEQLVGELALAHQRLAELEKRAAVNRQQMQDQRKQLVRMEKRVESFLASG